MKTMIQTLKKLKTIEPGEEFKKRSLTLILAAPQKNKFPFLGSVFQMLQFSGSLVLASLILVIVLGQFKSSSQLSGLNDKNLNNELRNMDLKIKLAEVRYFEDPLDRVDVALSGKGLPAEDGNLEQLLQELVL